MTEESTSQDSDVRTTAHRLRLGLLVVLCLLLVASVAAVAYLAATRPVAALGVDGQQEALQSERDRAMSQAEQFVLRVNTYGPDKLADDGTMPDYRKLVEEVITPKFAADFEKNAPLAEATVKQAGLARTAKVFSTGVSAIDSDSATVLVAGEITQSYPKKPGSDERVQTDPSALRFQVNLVKSHGTWLVDDFTPVAGIDQSGAPSPSDQPSGLPSPGASP